MNQNDLDGLKEVVSHLASDRFRPFLSDTDIEMIVEVVGLLASTVDKDLGQLLHHTLITRIPKAVSVIGYLVSKYGALHEKEVYNKRQEYARANIDVRDELERSGVKITEARVSAQVELDSRCIEVSNRVIVLGELVSLLSELKRSVFVLFDSLLELSRNARAEIKDKAGTV